jgi:tetratricopeptide (TPR) repeat protein
MGEKKRRLELGSTTVTVPTTQAVDAQLNNARRLLAQGKAREAFAQAQGALAMAPQHADTLHVLGHCCLAVGQATMGIGLLQSAAKARPDSDEYQIDLGRALASVGRHSEAVEPLQVAAGRIGNADVSRDLGAVLLRLGRVHEAEAAYQRAAELAQQRADLHEALARLRYDRNALDLAQRSFERALALDPSLIDRLNIGHARSGKADRIGEARNDPTLTPATPLQPAWLVVTGPTKTAGPAPSQDETQLQAACEARSLIIIDDFLSDAVAYRQRALQLAYPHSSNAAGINFPGRQSAAQPCAAIMQRLADALGRDVKWDSPDNGAFRISPADASARNDIHVDSDVRNEIYAAVLYLSLPEHCRGGTTFWRHRATGWERRPAPDQLAAAGYASFKQFEQRWMPVNRLRPFSELQTQREADWERVLQVPMRFNRLIVYRSDYFHSIDELFGDRPENARFVQLFFFEAVGATF